MRNSVEKDRNGEQEQFHKECTRRLKRIYRHVLAGDPQPQDEAELRGFMQAGLFMKLTDRQALDDLIEAAHYKIFGESRSERKQKSASKPNVSQTDFSMYESPAWERKKKEQNSKGSD